MGWMDRLFNRTPSLPAVRQRVETRLLEHLDNTLGSIADVDKEFEGWLILGSDRGGTKGRGHIPLDRKRAICREIVEEGGFAVNGLLNLKVYIVGTGMTYDWMVPGWVEDGAAPPDGVAANGAFETTFALEEWTAAKQAMAELWKDWSERHGWSEMEGEAVANSHRDGDYFIRLQDVGGEVVPRMVDPGDVVDDGSNQYPEGIRFDPADQQLPIAYHVRGIGWVPAEDMVHIRVNADSDVARGTPTYWPIREKLVRADKLLRNMAKLGEIQAALAIVREHTDPVGSATVRTFLDSVATKNPVDQRTGNTYRQALIREGSIVDVPAGQKLHFPTQGMGLVNYPPAVQAVLRACAVRLNMPEFMFTGDASNANYSSTFEASGPAVKTFGYFQAFYGRRFRTVARRVAEAAVRRRQVPLLVRALNLHVKGPTVESRNQKEEADVRKVEKDAGVLSVQTWSAESGRDYDREQRLRMEHDERMLDSMNPLGLTPDEVRAMLAGGGANANQPNTPGGAPAEPAAEE